MKKILIQKNHEVSLNINDQEFTISSVGTDNISFVASNIDEKSLCVKDVVDCELVFEEQTCLTKIYILAVTGQSIDGKFVSENEGYKTFIEHYFLPEMRGLTLKKIPKEKINNTGRGNAHWHYGGTEYEIYFNEEDGLVVSFQINFAKEMLTLDDGEITVGSLWEGDDIDRISHKGSHLIQDKKKISSRGMKNLYRFITACPNIEDEFRNQILEKIETRFQKDWK
jgi:hypothetical protein